MSFSLEGNAGSHNEDSTIPTKETFLLSSAEPGVTIVVGEKPYHEYGEAIRCWSKYFDRALQSGMKEQQSLNFEFPDRNPKEWEWIISLMSPMAKEKVTIEKLSVALDWFDFLCSNLGLETCDEVLRNHLGPPPGLPVNGKRPGKVTAQKLAVVMKYLPTVVKYNLKSSKDMCFRTLRIAIVHDAVLFNKDSLKTIEALVKENLECRSHLFGPLKTHLPSSVTEEQVEAMIAAGVIHEMINLQFDSLKAQQENNQVKTNLIEVLQRNFSGERDWHNRVCCVKQELSKDSNWKDFVPKKWR